MVVARWTRRSMERGAAGIVPRQSFSRVPHPRLWGLWISTKPSDDAPEENGEAAEAPFVHANVFYIRKQRGIHVYIMNQTERKESRSQEFTAPRLRVNNFQVGKLSCLQRRCCLRQTAWSVAVMYPRIGKISTCSSRTENWMWNCFRTEPVAMYSKGCSENVYTTTGGSLYCQDCVLFGHECQP